MKWETEMRKSEVFAVSGLYSDLLQGKKKTTTKKHNNNNNNIKNTVDSSTFSAERTIISASAVPHRGPITMSKCRLYLTRVCRLK